MTEQEQVELLLQRKETIRNDSSLSEDEKDKLLRKVRRDLRKIRGSSRTDDDSSDEPTQPKTKRERRFKEPESRNWQANPAAFQDYKADILMKLTDLGLDLKDPADLLDVTVQGYDLALGYNDRVSVEDLLQKFRDRWSNHEPKFYAITGGETMEILLMGPIPAGMVN